MDPRQCIFAFMLLTASSSGALGAIFDRDDRIRVDVGQASSLSAIGKVGSGLRWGTGFLISECHVLTVRHIFGRRKQPLGRKATFRITAPATGYVRSEGVVIASGEIANDANNRSDDWALIRLDSCLGRTVGYFDIMADLALTAHYATGPVRFAGVPRDSSMYLVMDPSCRIRHGTDLEWFHDCATLQGNSGSPVFRHVKVGERDQLRVVGIHTSGYDWTVVGTYDPRIANRATRIDILARAVAPYLQQQGSLNPAP